MAIRHIQCYYGIRTSGTADLTPTLSYTTTEGNYLIAQVWVSKTTGSLSTPTGFTEVVKVEGATNKMISAIYYKKITGSLENSVTVAGLAGSEYTYVLLREFSGVDGSNPIDSFRGVDGSGAGATTSVTMALSSATTNANTTFIYNPIMHFAVKPTDYRGFIGRAGTGAGNPAYNMSGYQSDTNFEPKYTTTDGSIVWQPDDSGDAGGAEGYVYTMCALTAADQTAASTSRPYISNVHESSTQGTYPNNIITFSPTDVVEGDVMYVVICDGNSAMTAESRRYLPVGSTWTEIGSLYNATNDEGMNHFYRVYQTGDEATTFSFYPGGFVSTYNIQAFAMLFILKNIDTTTPVEVSSEQDYSTTRDSDVVTTSTNTLQIITLGAGTTSDEAPLYHTAYVDGNNSSTVQGLEGVYCSAVNNPANANIITSFTINREVGDITSGYLESIYGNYNHYSTNIVFNTAEGLGGGGGGALTPASAIFIAATTRHRRRT